MSEIARLLIEQGRNAAAAREASGAIWGNAIANVSQIPGQVYAAQQQRADRQQATALATARETREAAGAADQHALQVAQLEKMRQSAASDWAEKLRVSNATPEMVQSEIDAATGKLWTPEESSALKRLASTPEGTTQLLTRLAPVREAKPAEPFTLKPGEQRFGPDNKPLASVPAVAARPVAVAPGSTLVDPTTNQPVFTAPKDETNTPLDQQLLKAIASGDTVKAGQIKQTLLTAAQARQDPAAAATARELAGLRVDEARARLDSLDTGSDKNQQKLEQQYRAVLKSGLSSRSGGLGLEDAKVQQANHLISLLDQSYDPKTDTYNIPNVQQTELAMGLARLVSPGGVVGEKTVSDINQATAKGDFNKALTYATGSPFNGTTQDLMKMYRDSILRQGETAQQNREGEMAYLRGLAPTDLAEERRQKLEATTLNPLRQSRVIQNKSTGERKLQVSLDGGVTWK